MKRLGDRSSDAIRTMCYTQNKSLIKYSHPRTCRREDNFAVVAIWRDLKRNTSGRACPISFVYLECRKGTSDQIYKTSEEPRIEQGWKTGRRFKKHISLGTSSSSRSLNTYQKSTAGVTHSDWRVFEAMVRPGCWRMAQRNFVIVGRFEVCQSYSVPVTINCIRSRSLGCQRDGTGAL